jgi:EAL domain-containing protein (putative c-di-GMP-specific phosphodiesterase class I)/DNA-binding NarL/FixJ family response regulator
MPTTVLIADDQVEVREALELLVATEPAFELVGMAEDVDQAIALAREHRPDVALVDFKMPGGGGPRATREIRASSPGTRVVALSAYGDRASVFQMLRAGAIGYLVKGASAQEVHDAIVRSASGERVLSAAVTADVVHELRAQLERESAVEEARLERVSRVRQALDEGGIGLVFQPIVALEDRKRVVGFEALARFVVAPDRGPAEWFAEASEIGLGVDLELATMRLSLDRIGELPAGAFLSVNAGPDTLVTPAAAELLRDAPAGRVVLEITEHAPVADYDALRRALVAFCGAGGRLAVDDAGAGFASLRHVLRLAPDIIKIDSGVIGEIRSDRAARALTAALLSFANEMGQLVIAEGVEDDDTATVLRTLGVPYGQGFHFGEPAPSPAARLE